MTEFIDTISLFVREHTVLLIIVAVVLIILAALKIAKKLINIILAIVLAVMVLGNLSSFDINPNKFSVDFKNYEVTINGDTYRLLSRNSGDIDGYAITSVYFGEENLITTDVKLITNFGDRHIRIKIPTYYVKDFVDLLIEHNVYYERNCKNLDTVGNIDNSETSTKTLDDLD